jgi:hypothetical protein
VELKEEGTFTWAGPSLPPLPSPQRHLPPAPTPLPLPPPPYPSLGSLRQAELKESGQSVGQQRQVFRRHEPRDHQRPEVGGHGGEQLQAVEFAVIKRSCEQAGARRELWSGCHPRLPFTRFSGEECVNVGV